MVAAVAAAMVAAAAAATVAAAAAMAAEVAMVRKQPVASCFVGIPTVEPPHFSLIRLGCIVGSSPEGRQVADNPCLP